MQLTYKKKYSGRNLHQKGSFGHNLQSPHQLLVCYYGKS